MKSETIRTQAGYFYVEDNILYSFLEGEIDEAKARDHIAKGLEYVPKFAEIPMLTVTSIRKMTKISRGARIYIGGADTKKLVIKNALVLNSAFQRVMVNFFQKFANPVYPSKVFTSDEKALEWLNE